MTHTLLFVCTFAAALGGFWIAAYVRGKKTRKETLVCPLGSDCDAVINSTYSNVFGIPVELMGMLYYACFALAALALLLAPSLLTGTVLLGILIAASLAEAFALYLIYIQFAVLKEWCLWCIGSFAASTLIFILTVFIH